MKVEKFKLYKQRIRQVELGCYFLVALLVCIFNVRPEFFSNLSFFVQQSLFSISVAFLVLVYLLAKYAYNYVNQQSIENSEKCQKLKLKQKSAKRKLVHSIDPVILDTMRDIVKKDMQEEIEKM